MANKLYYFSRLTPERVDTKEGIIRGVSIITGGVQAKGHPMIVDDQTVAEFFSACKSKGQIKTKANHKSGVKEVNGYLSDFRVVSCPTGDKLVGDWHLLKKDPNYEHTLEIAERMPATVGLSGSFTSPKGKEKGEETRFGKAARVKEVLSVDFVTDPAANPDGLFEAKEESVDTSSEDMEKTPTEIALEQILKNQSTFGETIKGLVEFNEALVAEREAFEQAQAEGTEEAVYEDAAGNQYTQAEVDAMESEESAESDPNENPEFAAMREKIAELEARAAAEDQSVELEKYERAFAVLDEKMTLLAAQRDEALAELEELKTPRVSTSSEGNRLFSAGIAGQTEFEQWVSSQVAAGKKRTTAITEFIATWPEKYAEHMDAKQPVAAINLSR